MIKCPHCGGEMDYEVKSSSVKCPYCKSNFNPEKLDAKVKTAKKKDNPLSATGKSYTCSQCGATLMTFDDTAITFCSYCGSQAMLDDVVVQKMSPDVVIPFTKTKEECIEEYKKVIKSNFLVPNYMKEDMVFEKFRGIFMPYAIYNLEFHGTNTAKGSKYSHRSGDYVYYDDYNVNADIDSVYNGISFDLSSNFYDQFSNAIPFNYKKAVKFNPNYLVGFYADNSNVDGFVYDGDAAKIANADARSRLLKHREYNRYNCTKVNTDLLVNDRKIGLFPVYFLAIRDKKNENVSYAVVNGDTGKIAVDLPVSFGKYAILSLIISAIIFVLINHFVVLTPEKVSFFAAGASLLCFILSAIQTSRINKRRNHTNDKGYSFLVDENEKPKKIGVLRYSYKALIAIIIPIVVVLTQAVDDYIYYLTSLISLGLVLLSFKDLVKEHNLLTTSKLPQLNKRGGDENA